MPAPEAMPLHKVRVALAADPSPANPDLLLGVDIGTLGVKGELVAPSGRVVATARLEHGCLYPRPDGCEQDMDTNWWLNPAAVIRQLLQAAHVRPEQIKAVGVSGLFPALGPTDEHGTPLRGAILYSDNRSAPEAEELNADLGLFLTTEELTPKLVWFLRHEPELASRMRMFFDAPHYLVYRLCGAYVTDTILAGLYGAIYHSPSASWRPEICARYGIPVGILPEVHPPARIVGTVHADAARRTGLAVGTPVLTGMPDLVASLIGAGAVRTSESVAYYGTAGLVPVMKQDLMEAIWHPFPHEERGEVALDGYLFNRPAYSLSVGGGLQWFRDAFARQELETERRGGLSAYAQLDQLAAAVPPGCEGLLMLPYLQGQRSPDFDPWATGVFFGLKASHDRAALYRAMLESFGYTIRHGLEAGYPQGHPLHRLVATGGGARSPLWRQIVSDITGIRQEYVPEADEALGDAYLAGMALGWFKDFDDLQSEWVRPASVSEPNPAAQATYDRLYPIYVDLHAALRPAFRQHHRALTGDGK